MFMNRQTGKVMTNELEHIKQSIGDILTTRLGSRVMLKGYGSRLFELVDGPVSNPIDFVSAATAALERHEPRIKVKRVLVSYQGDGRLSVEVRATHKASGDPITQRQEV